ncbi:hypothetical protein [Streptomyces sp. NPDC088812]|uniref:hypothetical protein n=1 Tax=Streptomyces sp. NPDC088812 TaxID=3365905 RepID=UPI00381ACDB2
MDHEFARETDGMNQLTALMQAGGFWRLAPEWVPRSGYASPAWPVLLRVRDGLERRSRREQC